MMGRQQKVWLVLLLFVHLLVHPALHEFSSSAPTPQVSQDTGSSTLKLDDCAFCRDASGLSMVAPVLLVYWQPVVLQFVPASAVETFLSFESSAESPRAPPAF